MIAADGHTHISKSIPKVKPTCTESGLTKGKACSECGEILTEQEEIPALGHSLKAIPKVDPTCTATGLTEGKICSRCGEMVENQEEIPALGHTTQRGIYERCGEELLGTWTTRYYVDDFGEETDSWYIVTSDMCSGTFSNSATTDSNLKAQVLFDNTMGFAFVLYEYGYHTVKNTWSIDTYYIVLRDQEGNDHEMLGYMYEDTNRVYLSDTYTNDVLSVLCKDGKVQFFLQDIDNRTSTYRFSVSTDDFGIEYANHLGDDIPVKCNQAKKRRQL